ncbi:hypothetical protein [Paenibacillus gallinarum]|nr:hypothetical protein [Paenibacillus gallinarum]
MITDVIMQGLLTGLSIFGAVMIFGLGIGSAIDLFKLFGGVR